MSKILRVGEMLYEWLSTFGASVYRQILPSAVEPTYPYIFMNGVFDNFATQINFPVKVFDMNVSSNKTVVFIASAIDGAVGEGGIVLRDTENNVYIKIDKGSPFYQDLDSGIENVRAGYINLTITIY